MNFADESSAETVNESRQDVLKYEFSDRLGVQHNIQLTLIDLLFRLNPCQCKNGIACVHIRMSSN